MSATAAQHAEHLDREQAEGDLAEERAQLACDDLPDEPPDAPEDEEQLPLDPAGFDHRTWRRVPGMPYEVSDFGEVRRGGRALTSRPNAKGYLVVSLYLDGRACPRRVSRLVALAFLGPAADGAQARHLDGWRRNNHVTNLAWGTQAQNERDKVRHGTHPCTGRERCTAGHLLVAPNLTARGLRRGWRECWSCKEARKHVAYHASRGRPLDLDVVMATFYARVVDQCERALDLTKEPTR